MELDDGHDDGDGLNEDQVLQLGKEERENKMSSRQRYILIEPFCFVTQDTIKGVSGFRIDNRTVKKENI
jgi:hypothetical protein